MIPNSVLNSLPTLSLSYQSTLKQFILKRELWYTMDVFRADKEGILHYCVCYGDNSFGK